MKHMGQGARRGRIVRTTTADPAIPCPLDRINRQFKANRPNQLWVSDFTYVSIFVLGLKMAGLWVRMHNFKQSTSINTSSPNSSFWEGWDFSPC